jgi:hypothetical protein
VVAVTRRNKQKTLFVVLITVALIAVAAGITIDARTFPYNQVNSDHDINDGSDFDSRNSAGTGLAGAYRAVHGGLPVGTKFTVIYGDGGGETAPVVSTTSTLGAVPDPNSQFAPCDLGPCPGVGPALNQH